MIGNTSQFDVTASRDVPARPRDGLPIA